MRTSTLPCEVLGLIEANASQRFALIPEEMASDPFRGIVL